MSTVIIHGGTRLGGLAVAPPDKSISHRALILAALGNGPTRISPLSRGGDNRSTLGALRAMGVPIEVDEAGSVATVTGVGGTAGLLAPASAVDCGNSGTTMRMLAGVAASMHGTVTLTGDESLRGRPMSRLLPLVAMGARIDGEHRGSGIYPPIAVTGAPGHLRGMRHELRVASAQVKSAILLAGLYADGPTTVREPERSRDHTERMLRALGVSVRTVDTEVTIEPVEGPWSVRAIEVAPDFSSAAFLLGAAIVTGSPDLVVETAVNPTRTGFLDVLEAFGAHVAREPAGERGGERVERLRVVPSASGLAGASIRGSLTLRAIDEIPLIAGVAAFARGTTEIRDAGELRVKESDRIRSTAALLRSFGAVVHELEDGLVVVGNRAGLLPARIEGGMDHRIALTAAVIGLGLEGCTSVGGARIIDVSYPGFVAEVLRLGGEMKSEGGGEVSD